MGGMLLYVLEIIKYGVVYRLLYEKKLKRIWLPVVSGVIYFVMFVIMYPEFDSAGKNALGYGFAWLTTFLMMGEKRGKKGTSFLAMFLTAIGVEQVVSIPLRVVGLFVKLEVLLGEYDSLVLSFLTLLAVSVAYLWKTKNKSILKRGLSKRTINFMIGFMIVGMLITVACVDFAEEYVSNIGFSVLTTVLCVTSYVSIGILGVFIIHIRKVNETMDEMLQNEIVLKDMQKSYYEALLEKEEETRNYRHDMVGHLLCLESFAKEGKTAELEAYLSKMQQQMRQIQGKKYRTGNQIIDVITNHYLSEADEQTEVQVSGFAEEDLKIDSVSLCSVYTNLLKNAVEELARIKEGKKKLKIMFTQGAHFFCIEIQNSLSERSKEKRSVLESEKGDRRNHGIGLRNVRKIVKEYEGTFDTKIDHDIFVARVTLNYKK